MKILNLNVDAAQYVQIIEKGQTELILPITEELQDQYVKITPQEVTMLLYDKIVITSEDKKAEIEVVHTELDYYPDEEGYIQLYEAKNHKLYIADANIVYHLGERNAL